MSSVLQEAQCVYFPSGIPNDAATFLQTSHRFVTKSTISVSLHALHRVFFPPSIPKEARFMLHLLHRVGFGILLQTTIQGSLSILYSPPNSQQNSSVKIEMAKVIVLKLAKGTPAPPGYTYVRSTRTLDFYNKTVQTVTKTDMDDLASLFGTMGVVGNTPIAPVERPAVAIVEDTEVSALMNAFGGLGMGGRRRKASRKSRKSKKSRKNRKSRKN
jgi:hypothetical protein